MAKKEKMSDFKKVRIKKFTGGKIIQYKGLDDSFVSMDGKTYIGEGDIGWMYFKHNMVVDPKSPSNVAIVLKNKPDSHVVSKDIKDKDIKGYYGYSHRGGLVFNIGMRLFDEKYKPNKKDYTKKEWEGFEKEYEKYIKEEMKSYDWTRKEAEKNLSISHVIPFKMRGKKIITNLKEARKSAVNISEYLS